MLKNKKSKKKKKNEKDNITDNKKVTINDPNCNIKPLSLNNISNNNNYNDKENDYYLINTSTYIGLKNSNSNLVFLKNQKDIISDKYELTPLLKTKIVSGYDKKMDNNAAKNLTPTKKNEKNDSNVSTNKNENSAKNVNKYEIVDNKNNNDNRILEIYINNQAKKISKLLKKNSKRYNNNNNNNNNNVNNNNNNNNNSKVYNNNSTYYINNKDETRLQKFNNAGIGINGISFDILNTGTCQTIINKKNNFCIKYFENGSIYIGEVENDKCNGHGKFLNTKGDITMSFFEDNYLQGYGLIEIRRNNSIFEGDFDKNQFNGYGIELYEDGSTYYGKYENNEKSGIGTYDWGDGSQYQGEWKNGLPDGYGTFSDSKNRIYEGEWKYGKMNGIGLYKWDDGRKYIGLFNEDKREGFGIFFWPKPLKIYLGFWINGTQNGIGKIYTSFKEKYYLWEEGKLLKNYLRKKH